MTELVFLRAFDDFPRLALASFPYLLLGNLRIGRHLFLLLNLSSSCLVLHLRVPALLLLLLLLLPYLLLLLR